MGTRHLIGVVLDGDFKIAQYGQWDGYPSGQGATIHEFLTNPNLDIIRFIEAVRRLHWITDEETERINRTPDWPKIFPWMSRDAGAEILAMVYAGLVDYVGDGREFGYDGLFCEWAYVIDLDGENPTLEVYGGFHKDWPTTGRWAAPMPPIEEGLDVPLAPSGSDYAPVHLIKTYELGNMPSLEDFVTELEGAEEDVDA